MLGVGPLLRLSEFFKSGGQGLAGFPGCFLRAPGMSSESGSPGSRSATISTSATGTVSTTDSTASPAF